MQCDDKTLEAMRHIGDESADRLVDLVLDHLGEGEQTPQRRLMGHLIEFDALPPTTFPEPLRKFLHDHDRTTRLEAETINRGQAIFAEHGPEILMALAAYSLPGAYAANKGARVLVQTGYLTSFPNRRLLETSQMIIDVMRPGGLDPDGRGVASARKVRLMHAAIRHLILERTDPAWETNELGIPINQEDLAGTFTTFAWVPLDALSKLGVDLPLEDKDAFIEVWCHVARIMGIREELLPANFSEAELLTRRIQARQVVPSEANPAGQELTKALLGMMDSYLPGRFLDPAASAMMRFFLPGDVADSLDIPRNRIAEFYIGLGARVIRMCSNWRLATPMRRFLFRGVSLGLIQAFVDHGRGGKRTEFDLPLSLRGAWQRD